MVTYVDRSGKERDRERERVGWFRTRKAVGLEDMDTWIIWTWTWIRSRSDMDSMDMDLDRHAHRRCTITSTDRSVLYSHECESIESLVIVVDILDFHPLAANGTLTHVHELCMRPIDCYDRSQSVSRRLR